MCGRNAWNTKTFSRTLKTESLKEACMVIMVGIAMIFKMTTQTQAQRAFQTMILIICISNKKTFFPFLPSIYPPSPSPNPSLPPTQSRSWCPPSTTPSSGSATTTTLISATLPPKPFKQDSSSRLGKWKGVPPLKRICWCRWCAWAASTWLEACSTSSNLTWTKMNINWHQDWLLTYSHPKILKTLI